MRHHAPPPHSHSRTRSSGLQNRKVAPPLESSSANLPFGGGTASIGVHTRLHVPEKVSETTFTCSSTAASFEAQNGVFPDPIQETGTTIRFLGGRYIVCRQDQPHRTPHAPPRAVEAPTASFARTHAPSTCSRVPGTRLPATGTRWRHVSVHGFAASALIASQHATWQEKKKKKEKFGETERGSSTVQIHPQGLYGLASKLSFLNLLFMQFP